MDEPSSRPQALDLPEGTVTVLFSDVEGSTDLRTREGDDVAQEVMRTHEKMLREQIELFGGYEVVFMGDGFMVAFGSARKGIECAIGIQRCFAEHNATGPEHHIRVRIGLNTGEVVRESGTLYGTAVNAAARISAKAKGGEILISQITKDLTTGVRDFTFLERGMFDLKGFPTQWQLHEVVWDEAAIAEAPKPVPAAPAAVPEPVAPTRLLDETYVRPDRLPIVGRNAERAAVDADIDAVAAGQIRVYAVEGEAGIGKTRLIESTVDAAAAKGFGSVIVGGDEELRGPFFILRTLLSSTSIQALADKANTREALERARDVVSGRGQSETGLSPAEQTLRVYDVATVAIRSIAESQPLAMLFDDLQWADEDSLKLIRYIVRTSSTSPLFIMLAQRPDPGPRVGAGTSLVADLERMGLARRKKLERLTRAETAELLDNLLETPVSQETAAALHARGEGVPFFIVEFARAFRDAGLMHVVGGKLELSQAARSTVAPNVQILIERRLAQLDSDARDLIADAAVIGRRFRLSELRDVEQALNGDAAPSEMDLADRLEPVIAANLVIELPEEASYDYTFTHDEIRAALIAQVARQRRRKIHGAIASRLEAALDTGGSCLATLAFHFLESGEQDQGVRYSIRTAHDSLHAFAPEEALRAVDLAKGAAQSPEDRAELLRLRDHALEALGRAEERIATLAEMSALARALGDDALELEATLRRASATRQTEDFDRATEIALEALEIAQKRDDKPAELRASLELGQARLQRPLGESYSPASSEVDVDAAGEAYARALTLATEIGDESTWAAVRREQGVIRWGQMRKFVLEMLEQKPDLFDDPTGDPREIPEIRRAFDEAQGILQEAVAAYERLGDQRGLMSSLIALAYANILEETRHGHAGRLEQIRLLRRNLKRLTSEAERAESDAYMLFSIQVYSRSHGPLDLALLRGTEAYEAAHALGNRSLELYAAGGVALTYAVLGQIAEAETWLDKAGGAALVTTDSLPDRQLETWRGQVRAAAGDAEGATRHLERALKLATERGSPGGRAEVLSILAVEAARLGADAKDEELLARAQSWAEETLTMSKALPASDAPFAASAHAALAQIAHARGDRDAAYENAIEAAAEFKGIRQIFAFLYVEPRFLVARALVGFEDPVADEFRMQLRGDVIVALFQTSDDAIRARWLSTPLMSELMGMVGGSEALRMIPSGAAVPAGLSLEQADILRRVMSGQTNREIAEAIGRDEKEAAAEVTAIFEAIGATNRNEAATEAVRQGIV
ncbi:MAG TPA: AAA family ATPase [Actinomycetota bacterium]|nr:AAA family ATPase [Actinomycetota bacterium]